MKVESFSHFPPEALDFLTALKANNNREWFAENKAVYERAVKTPAENFCRTMAERLEDLTGQPHLPKIFRVHRDVRFSKDKTPYNTHLHISFMPEADSILNPGWYFGLQPERLVAGTGIFEPAKATLDAFRARVAANDGDRLSTLTKELSASNVRLSAPELKRVPQPYPAEHPRADLLRHKSLTAWVNFHDPRIACEKGFSDRCFGAFTRLKPLFDWLAAPN